MVNATPIAPGTACALGGFAVASGEDDGAGAGVAFDGVLGAEEVDDEADVWNAAIDDVPSGPCSS